MPGVRRRMNALYRFAREMSDCARCVLPIDQRRRAFGRPLDFVFYRGLNVSEALYWLRALPITIRYSLNSVPASLINLRLVRPAMGQACACMVLPFITQKKP